MWWSPIHFLAFVNHTLDMEIVDAAETIDSIIEDVEVLPSDNPPVNGVPEQIRGKHIALKDKFTPASY